MRSDFPLEQIEDGFPDIFHRNMWFKYIGYNIKGHNLVSHYYKSERGSDYLIFMEKKQPQLLLQSYLENYSVCSNILPFRFMNGRLFMLNATGDLGDLLHEKGPLSFSIAHRIVRKLCQTLYCLKDIGLYYFDLKCANVMYRLRSRSLSIWLGDLDSVIPNRYGDYCTTFPHLILNRMYTQGYTSGYINITEHCHEFVTYSYAYMLARMFFELIGVINSNWAGHSFIDNFKGNLMLLSARLKMSRFSLYENYTFSRPYALLMLEIDHNMMKDPPRHMWVAHAALIDVLT